MSTEVIKNKYWWAHLNAYERRRQSMKLLLTTGNVTGSAWHYHEKQNYITGEKLVNENLSTMGT